MPALTHSLARHTPLASRSAARTVPALSADLSAMNATRAAGSSAGAMGPLKRSSSASRSAASADMGTGRCQCGAERVAGRRAGGHQRKAKGVADLAQQREAGLDGGGIGLEKIGVHERQQAILAAARPLKV